MADYLAQSSAQADQMTAAALPYIRQGADFGTPLIQGVEAGQGIALRGRQMALQELQAESQVRDMQQRALMYQGELALRRDQMMTQAAEAQGRLQVAQAELALRKMSEQRQEKALNLDFMNLPPMRLKSGEWRVFDMQPDGRAVMQTVLIDDPRVQRFLQQEKESASLVAQREAQTAATTANTELNRQQFEFGKEQFQAEQARSQQSARLDLLKLGLQDRHNMAQEQRTNDAAMLTAMVNLRKSYVDSQKAFLTTEEKASPEYASLNENIGALDKRIESLMKKVDQPQQDQQPSTEGSLYSPADRALAAVATGYKVNEDELRTGIGNIVRLRQQRGLDVGPDGQRMDPQDIALDVLMTLYEETDPERRKTLLNGLKNAAGMVK